MVVQTPPLDKVAFTVSTGHDLLRINLVEMETKSKVPGRSFKKAQTPL